MGPNHVSLTRTAAIALAALVLGAALVVAGPATSRVRDRCKPGKVWGYATVDATGTFSSTYTSSGVVGFSCRGGTVQAKRSAQGLYLVQFNGVTFPSTDQVNVQLTATGTDTVASYGVGTGADTGNLRVQTIQTVGGSSSAVDTDFTVTVFKAVAAPL